MDLSEVETVRLSNEPVQGQPLVDVRFFRRPRYDEWPAMVEVAGSDHQWVGGVIEVLRGEVSKGVPWWAFLRRGLFGTALGAVLGLGAAGVALRYALDSPDRGSVFALAFSGLFFGGFIGVALLVGVFRMLFPGFEVVEQGSNSRGRRVLGGLITLLGISLSTAGVVLGALAL